MCNPSVQPSSYYSRIHLQRGVCKKKRFAITFNERNIYLHYRKEESHVLMLQIIDINN